MAKTVIDPSNFTDRDIRKSRRDAAERNRKAREAEQEARIEEVLPYLLDWAYDADPEGHLSELKASSTAWNAATRAAAQYDSDTGTPWLAFAHLVVTKQIKRTLEDAESYQVHSERVLDLLTDAAEKKKF